MDWEQATHQARTRGIGGLDNPNVWFSDLCQSIEPVLTSWVSIFQRIYQEKLEDKSLAIRTVVKTLRLEVSRRGFQKPVKALGRVNRGTFGPTYNKYPDQAAQPDQEQDPDKKGQLVRSAGPRRPKRNRKRKSDQPGPEAKKAKSKDGLDQGKASLICEACDGKWHTWVTCYYVFPTTAPAWFKFRPLIQDGVKYRLSFQEWKDRLKNLKAGSARSD